MVEPLPKWIMRRYAKLWNAFSNRNFNFEKASNTLKEKDQRIIAIILSELDKFARKNEMIVVERMLKDFQPLEFARMKDVQELIQGSAKISKEVKNESENIQTKKQKSIKIPENIE